MPYYSRSIIKAPELLLYSQCDLNMAKPHRPSANALLTISAFALCVVLPFVKLGIPSGHDFEFHLNSWIEVAEHWKQVDFYPHWAALAHYGYGEARFIFYPPFSWTLGALLGTVLPWKFVPAAYIWIVLTLAGYSMFRLARRWLPHRDAVFAAVLYAANPYNLVIVYWRSAMAELMAAIYLPLLLLLILRGEKDLRRMVVPLSLLMAAGWLTNLPSAVMMNYSVLVLALVIALRRRSPAFLVYSTVAIVLGAMLAGFYLLPAFHEQTWVNISQVLAPGVRPVDNFLFTRTTDADHNRFNLLVSIVAVSEMALLLLALVGLRRRYRNDSFGPTANGQRPTTNRHPWSVLLTWSTFCALLMFRPTLPLWLYLPKLRFVQLPWRWLLCLSVAFAFTITFGVRRWWLRAFVCTVALATVLIAWRRVQVPWWDNAADIQEMLDNQHDGVGNEGTDEYVPAGADPYDIDQNAPLVRFDGNADSRINVQQWFAERRMFMVNGTAPGNLVLRLFNYPYWKVRVNGQLVKTGTTAHTGQMTIPISAGQSQVQINFVQGWDRRVGTLFSVIACVALLLWLIASRRGVAVLELGAEG
jgi:6-pyruvoyl-tetrahydropterin synthase related domain